MNTIAINNSSEDPTSLKKNKQKFSISLSETKPDRKQVYNEMVRMTKINENVIIGVFFS